MNEKVFYANEIIIEKNKTSNYINIIFVGTKFKSLFENFSQDNIKQLYEPKYLLSYLINYGHDGEKDYKSIIIIQSEVLDDYPEISEQIERLNKNEDISKNICFFCL